MNIAKTIPGQQMTGTERGIAIDSTPGQGRQDEIEIGNNRAGNMQSIIVILS